MKCQIRHGKIEKEKNKEKERSEKKTNDLPLKFFLTAKNVSLSSSCYIAHIYEDGTHNSWSVWVGRSVGR